MNRDKETIFYSSCLIPSTDVRNQSFPFVDFLGFWNIRFCPVPLGWFGDQKESLASFAANATANAEAMGPSPEEKAARVRAAELEAARVAPQAEMDGVRYVGRRLGGKIKITLWEISFIKPLVE